MKRGLLRLGIVLGVPCLLGWGWYQFLVWTYRADLTSFMGTRTDPVVLQREAERFARLEIAGVFPSGIGPVVFLLACWALPWLARGFTAPIARAERIRTRRLVLRRLHTDDVPALHAIFADAETLEFWDTHPHVSIAETQAHLERICTETNDEFVVEREGRVIGLIGSVRAPWVSFIFARQEWRKGYAGEALMALIDYLAERGLPTLCAVTDQRNAAARALLARAGFQEFYRGSTTHEATGAVVDIVALASKPIEVEAEQPLKGWSAEEATAQATG